MKKILPLVIVIPTLLIVVIYLAANHKDGGQTKPIACTQEARVCPDGSAVGRTGPDCEFAACPATSTIANTITKETNSIPIIPVAQDPRQDWVGLGKTIIIGGIRITPFGVPSDSRCPKGVTCIWAGTVSVSVRLEEEGRATIEATSTLHTPISVGDKKVTLYGVTPVAIPKIHITPSDYRFNFLVTSE